MASAMARTGAPPSRRGSHACSFGGDLPVGFLAAAGHGQPIYPGLAWLGGCPEKSSRTAQRAGPGSRKWGAMRKVPLAGAAAALVLGLAGVAAFSAVSQAA